jgi:KDO2-lipid IV(A) lauroyltransferase
MNKILKQIRYIIEAGAVYFFFYLFKFLGTKNASNFCGYIFKNIGPKLEVNRTAMINLRIAFPRKTHRELTEINIKSWENFGRTCGEFPTLVSLRGEKFFEKVEVKGREFVESLSAQNLPYIFVSAHYGNWEISCNIATQIAQNVALVYRGANNIYVDNLIQKSRGDYTNLMIDKADGARDLVKHIRNKGVIAMLLDQKMNSGFEVDFFGKKVMAPSAVGELSIKYNVPIIPGRVIRKPNSKFIVELFPPLDVVGKTSVEITQQIYNIFENWINEYPEEWFWLHRRFKNEEY